MNRRQRTGRVGERISTEYLRSHGYEVLDTNVRVGRNEIDILAKKDDTLVFVEVRTRRGDRMGTPEESITTAKQTRMANAALSYLQQQNLPESTDWRIDLVALVLGNDDKVLRIQVIENAVEG